MNPPDLESGQTQQSTIVTDRPIVEADLVSPHALAEVKDYIVDFDGPDDLAHPYNWTLRTK